MKGGTAVRGKREGYTRRRKPEVERRTRGKKVHALKEK